MNVNRSNRRTWTSVVPLLVLLVPTTLCGQELAPWKSNRHPTDVPKRHVEEIVAGTREYTVVQGGTMDGRNCRSPQGVWTPFEQTWESNRSVRMENVGDTDVVNPWLVSDDNDLRSVRAIVARAIEPGMTDREKAMALWRQEVQHRFHYPGDNRELLSPVKVLNVYGHNTCGNDSICLAGLWKAAGLKVAPARLVGHCVTQVYYDGAWHLYDGDMQSLYLLRDNETIAGEQDLVRDHDLVKRTHTQGILRPQGRAGDEWEASIYVFEGNVTGDRDADRTSSMNMTLRPGEALVWRWGHTEPPKYFGPAEHKFAERICNGLWEYRPDFSRETWRKGAERARGVVSGDDGLAAEAGKTGEIVWTVRAPYVVVGGRLEIDGTGAEFEISWDGKTWESAGSNLDPFFPPTGTARYSYYLRCRLEGAARLRGLGIVNDLQMAPLSLPEMGIGENRFTYSDESTGKRRVRISHEWVERSASTPPAAPAAPIWPPDRGEAEGTAIAFQWQPAADSDGDKIADYHFELSARADMKWPLSMSFAKLISRTSDAGSARYTLKDPGELNPDREYYWHVRAKDEKGVWGPWSQTWRFTPRGPAPPLEVSMDYDPEKNRGILRWEANRLGRRPVAYRIYASDEKGFSISDAAFEVAAGVYDFRVKESSKPPTQFAANLLGETSAAELAAIGTDVELPGANKAYYRVVAVDEKGNRSGPSDYAAAPRPVIYTRPVHEARTGTEYRYQVRAIRSMGDVRTRVVDGREAMNYWDVEQLQFRIEKGPTWLTIDEATGQLSGTPNRAGREQVVVAATLQHEQRRLDPAQLQWGIEKATDSRVESVGTTKQAFVIETKPELTYPGEAWPAQNPAEVGLDEAKLKQARDYALTGGGSGYITRRGALVMQWGDPKKRYDLKSTSKSIGVTALGLAIKDGRLKLTDKAGQHHPQFGTPPEENAKTGWLDDITLWHLATQTAGFEKPGGYGKVLFEPGTKWLYSDAGPNWIAECVTLAYRRDVDELMFARVFEPLGISREDLVWRKNAYRPHQIDGIMRREFGSGIHANVDAMARIGYFYLRDGKWGEEQIIPADFVKEASTAKRELKGLEELDAQHHGNASDHYGLLWWNNADGTLDEAPRDAYWSWGLYDSLIVVVPSLDLVVSRAGSSWKRTEGADHYDVLRPFLTPIAQAVGN